MDEVLKKGTESIVKRIFVTGVSPITLDSLTSGFNISDNMTRYEEFNEMMELYFECFNKKINEEIDYEVNTSDIVKAIRKIALDGDNDSLIKVVEKTLNKLSNRDYIHFDEKYVKLIFLAYCFLSKIYLVKSEYEVNDGYIDIALLKQVNMEPNYFAIFELKYITKEEYKKDGEK